MACCCKVIIGAADEAAILVFNYQSGTRSKRVCKTLRREYVTGFGLRCIV